MIDWKTKYRQTEAQIAQSVAAITTASVTSHTDNSLQW